MNYAEKRKIPCNKVTKTKLRERRHRSQPALDDTCRSCEPSALLSAAARGAVALPTRMLLYSMSRQGPLRWDVFCATSSQRDQ